MNILFRDLFPNTPPSPFLAVIGDCFGGTLVLTAVIVVTIRMLWRRDKGMYDR
jgi:hypothetical protein